MPALGKPKLFHCPGKTPPKIYNWYSNTGTITYKVDGETRYADNALVALQNKARTKTYAYTSTNERGEYTFFPVTGNQRYTVTATLDTYNGLKRIQRKIKYGHEYNVDFKLNEIWLGTGHKLQSLPL